jgi:hypothetical protein
VNIPTPNEFAKEHGFQPFPPRWEKWLSSVREGILSAQPRAGRHVTIDEHPGKGTVINVERPRGTPSGTCDPCTDEEKTVDFSGILLNYETCIEYPDLGGSTVLHFDDDINTTYSVFGFGPDPEDNPPGGCVWDGNGSFTGQIRHDDYLTSDCTGDPFVVNQVLGWGMDVACMSGTWYFIAGVLIGPGNNTLLFFYGSGSSTTITNSLTDYSGFNEVSLEDPFIEWLYGEPGPQLFTAAGKNGSITFNP